MSTHNHYDSNDRDAPKASKRRRGSHSSQEENDRQLPLELWGYIISFVAAYSLEAALELRTVCKSFKRIADDVQTYSSINMGGFDGHSRHTGSHVLDLRVRIFANYCWEAKNPEMLYRQGMLTLVKTANFPLALHYFDMACRSGMIYYGDGCYIEYHDVAFYVASMLRIIQGTSLEREVAIQRMCSRLNAKTSGWAVDHCCTDAELWMKELYPGNRRILDHIPPNVWSFQPEKSRLSFLPSDCRLCGESMFWRPNDVGEYQWNVNCDPHNGMCCNACKCYVEAVYFYKMFRSSAPNHEPHQRPIFDGAYRSSTSLAKYYEQIRKGEIDEYPVITYWKFYAEEYHRYFR